MNSKTILGIDPALTSTGWAIVAAENNKYSFINCGTVTTNAKESTAFRLKFISDKLNQVIEIYKPTEIALEETFVNNNNLSSLKLGQARGAIILTIAQNNLEIFEYSATNVKKSIVGVGRAEKQQVDRMIKILLPKAIPKTDHESDAIAIALTHLNTSFNYRKVQ